MTKPLTPEASRALVQALEALGIRPFRCGSLTLHWGQSGRLEKVEERRSMTFSHETVAPDAKRVHTDSRH